MPMLEVNGQELYYVKEGVGPNIVFIHSMGADFTMWRDQFAYFEKRFCCIAFDCRGHGGSSYTGPFSIGDLAMDLKAGLDRIGIHETHIVGIAMGGPIALSFTAQWPDMVQSLVIANSFVDLREPSKGRIEATRKRLAAMSMHDFGKEYALTRLMPDTPKEHYDELAEAIAEVEPEAYIDTLRAVLEAEFTDELSKVDVPTLVLFGAEDTVAPEHHSAMIRDGISGAVLQVIAGAGHLSNLDKPDEFNAAIAEFLDAQLG
jgi:pimeloyl-ACP methyl ester carboxylesterase